MTANIQGGHVLLEPIAEASQSKNRGLCKCGVADATYGLCQGHYLSQFIPNPQVVCALGEIQKYFQCMINVKEMIVACQLTFWVSLSR